MLRQEDGEGKLSTRADFTFTIVFGDVGRGLIQWWEDRDHLYIQ